jgi:ATP-binding cassette subfamily B protein
MSLKLIEHCNSLDLSTLESSTFQDRLQRAQTQISSQVAILQSLLQALQQLISIAGIMLSAVLVAPGLISVQLIGVLPIVLVESYFARMRYSISRQRTPVRRLLDYVLTLVGNSVAVKEIRLFSTGDFLYEKYRSISEEHNKEDVSMSTRVMKGSLFLTSLATFIYYFSYAILIHDAMLGLFTIGRLVFLAGVLQSFRGQLSALLGNLSHGFDQLLYVSDVFEVFSEKSRLISIGVGRPIPLDIADGIEFRNVSYTYNGRAKAALENVSFKIRPGEVIALVGENGAGKSTIIKLLTRLYDPSAGEILLDGIDLREFSRKDLCNLVTSVFQDYVKYDFSAALNIAMGKISAVDDTSLIESVATRTGADVFIDKMPDRYEQTLGRRFANSVDLSGGQWQRVALARAFMRDARIIILDEPTAAVDPRAEAALYQDAIRSVAGKMTILVSHRLSTVRFADRILVFKNGSVIENGTHDLLMKARGEYFELFTLQAHGYK